MGAGSIRLLSGWFVPLLSGVGMVLLAVAWGWRTRRWRLSILVLATIAVGLLWLLNLVFGGSWILQPAPPMYVCVLAAVPVFALASIPLGWGSASRVQRALLGPAVVTCTLAAAALINQYYAYYPTVEAVFSQHPEHEMSMRELHANGYLVHHSSWLATMPPAAEQPAAETPPRSTPPVAGTAQGAPVAFGRLVHLTIPGTVSGFRARRAWVYLPPIWFSSARPKLPVVLLLNGSPGGPDDWIRQVQIQRVADSYAASHGGWSPILVAADENGSFAGDTECVDRRGAMAETYLVDDVHDFVQRTFDTAVGPEHWAVEGFSEGGTCAITLALRHPATFGTFIDIAGEAAPSIGSPSKTLHDLFNSSAAARQSYDPAALLRAGHGRGLAGWFQVGTSDGKYERANRALAALASTNGVAVQLRLLAGDHDFRVFRAGFVDSFPWLCERLAAS